MNLKLTEEVEKLETMLKLQSSINKDLHQVLYCIVLWYAALDSRGLC